MLLSLSGLHNSHNDCINDVTTLNIDVRVYLRVRVYGLSLLVSLGRNIINLEVRVLEA